jgi:hypothetical protein
MENTKMPMMDSVIKDLELLGALSSLTEKIEKIDVDAAEKQSPSDVSRIVTKLSDLRERLDEVENVVREVKISLMELENECGAHGGSRTRKGS